MTDLWPISSRFQTTKLQVALNLYSSKVTFWDPIQNQAYPIKNILFQKPSLKSIRITIAYNLDQEPARDHSNRFYTVDQLNKISTTGRFCCSFYRETLVRRERSRGFTYILKNREMAGLFCLRFYWLDIGSEDVLGYQVLSKLRKLLICYPGW